MAHSIGAYNITVTKEYVKSTARCSCGVSNYNYGTSTFLNYCPGCHHYGTLHYEVGDYYGADYTSPEGLWHCAYCDRDRNIEDNILISSNIAVSVEKSIVVKVTG